jgi:hypothetical protein
MSAENNILEVINPGLEIQMSIPWDHDGYVEDDW